MVNPTKSEKALQEKQSICWLKVDQGYGADLGSSVLWLWNLNQTLYRNHQTLEQERDMMSVDNTKQIGQSEGREEACQMAGRAS